VRAGLALVDAVANLRTSADVALQVRIGIATGTVVVSEILSSRAATVTSNYTSIPSAFGFG
jgi:class 3 adenylate cyclase